MKRTPCEYVLWNLLPSVRHEIAISMINDFGLNQKEAAAKLGITPAAVCMYLSEKRGKSNIKDETILKEIKKSAENIIKDKNIDLIEETCRLCKIIKSKGLFPFFNLKNYLLTIFLNNFSVVPILCLSYKILVGYLSFFVFLFHAIFVCQKMIMLKKDIIKN